MTNKQDKKTGSFIVSWDFSRNNDTDILLVGGESNGSMTIVNAFQGKEARDIYNKLSSVKNGGSK